MWRAKPLYKFTGSRYFYYPPSAMRQILLEQVHLENVHIGAEKMFERLSEEVYWPTMFQDCYTYTRACLAC